MKWILKAFVVLTTGLGIMVGCSPVSFDVDEKAVCGDLDAASCNPIGPNLAEYTSAYTVAPAKVDVLIVNDNSGTMRYEQREMGNRFNTFINRLSGFNWQLGITTMDVSNANRNANGEQSIAPTVTPNANLQDGKLVPFYNGSYILREGQSDALNLFRDAIEIEQQGLSDERGILTASMALQNSANSGLVRSDSTHVAIIMLTDEDVRSGGEANNTNPATAGLLNIMPRDRKENLLSVWNQVNSNRNKTISVHSLIVQPGNSGCYNAQRTQVQPNGQIFGDATFGLMYDDISKDPTFKGIVGNICSSNYSSELSTISNYIAGRAQGDVPLNKTCDIITNNPDRPITIDLQNSNGNFSFRLGIDPLPPGFTNIQAFPGRVEFTPGLNQGTNVQIRYSCNI